jgi:hypothetical protein
MTYGAHWTDGLEGLPDAVRDQIVGEQIKRAESPAVAEALAGVHEAARTELQQEGIFEMFVLVAGAAVLRGWQVSEGIELYRRLEAYQQYAGSVRSALRIFLLTQRVNARQI